MSLRAAPSSTVRFVPARRIATGALLVLATGATARAQWTTVDLHPTGTSDSRALAVNGQQQVGSVGGQAALWLGSAASFVDLGPGVAVATDGVRQVGNRTQPNARPVMWSGSFASQVVLPDSFGGVATAIDGAVQVGWLAHQTTITALVWENGGAPSGCSIGTGQLARVWGVHAGQFVGDSGALGTARLWTCDGTNVDLGPAGTANSSAIAVHAGSQVGWTSTTIDGIRHAGLWSGTAASWVDLHPAGANESIAFGVHGGLQAGIAIVGSTGRATLWIGSAASAIDLHAFAPVGTVHSAATGVWTDANGVTTVSGFLTDAVGRDTAVLWVGSIDAPTAYCFGDGSGTACPCGNASQPRTGTGCANTTGAGGRLTGRGIASIAADGLELVGDGMPNSSVLYFQGTARTNGGSGAVFGDGLRCASGTVVRLGTTTNVAGGSHYPGVGDAPISVRGSNSAGDVRQYQAWYRNAAPFCTPSTFNTTNGVAVTWQP